MRADTWHSGLVTESPQGPAVSAVVTGGISDGLYTVYNMLKAAGLSEGNVFFKLSNGSLVIASPEEARRMRIDQLVLIMNQDCNSLNDKKIKLTTPDGASVTHDIITAHRDDNEIFVVGDIIKIDELYQDNILVELLD